MAARFFYQDFTTTESTDSYLRSQILGVTEKHFKDGKYNIYIRTMGPGSKFFGKVEPYSCEVRLDVPNSVPLFFKKQGTDFFQTVKLLGDEIKERVKGIRR